MFTRTQHLNPINIVFQFTHVVKDVKSLSGQRNNSHDLTLLSRNLCKQHEGCYGLPELQEDLIAILQRTQYNSDQYNDLTGGP